MEQIWLAKFRKNIYYNIQLDNIMKDWSGQSYNIKLIATVSAIDSTTSDVLEVEMV